MNISEVLFETVVNSLPERKSDTHKGDYGKVLIISGSRNYTGAPYFAAQAAVNAGSGLVFLVHPMEIHTVLAIKLNEVVLLPQENDGSGNILFSEIDSLFENISKYDVCLAGPGLGNRKSTRRITRELLRQSSVPIVLDADCLNSIADDVDCLKKTNNKVVITPHEGEFKRLCPEFKHDMREEYAKEFACKYGCITVLKGNRTVTALPDGKVFINSTGNPGMAKGGSGDVLAGIIASLIGQGIAPEKAAYIGVWIHGRAGDMCRDKYGEYGMTPTDMLSEIKYAVKECTTA